MKDIETILLPIFDEKIATICSKLPPSGLSVFSIEVAKKAFSCLDELTFIVCLKDDNTWKICYNYKDCEEFFLTKTS